MTARKSKRTSRRSRPSSRRSRRFGDAGGKFKQITGPDDAFAYAHRLGFAGTGPIVYQQASLAAVVDALLAASGNETWYHKVYQPFGVRFTNYIAEGSRYRFPWLGTFTVKAIDGTTRTVNMRDVKKIK